MNENISKKLRLSLFVLVLVFIIIVSMFFSTKNQRIETGSANDYNDQWLVYNNDVYLKEVSLPDKISAEKNDSIKIQKELNNDFKNNQVLMIRGSLQSIVVVLDGQVIYQKTFDNNAFNTHASLYHFVEIPDNSNGKTIEIITVSPYKNMSGTLNEVYYGNQSSLRDFLLENNEFKLYIAIFLVIMSIIFIIISRVFFNKQQSYQIYIGVFGVFMGLWIFAESRIVQLYFNNDFLIGSLAYLSLASAPIAAAAFTKYFIFESKYRIFSYLCFIYSLNLFIISFLHIFQIFAFFETVMITISLISIGFIIAFIYLIKEYMNTKNKKYRNYTLILFSFSIFIFLEVAVFANKNFSDTGNFASTGIAGLFLLLFIINFYNLSKKLKISLEQQLYEEIANTDQLTKAGSRFAFEKEFDRLFYSASKDVSLIYFDFDDLKQINDDYGHIEGDKALIKGYKFINKIFGDYGKCYRIGGDEFACLTSQLDEELFNNLKYEFKELLNNTGSNNLYSTNISIGYTKLNLEIDKKPSDLILRADKQMYLDKKTNKTQAK